MPMVHNKDHIQTLKASEEAVGQLQPCVKEKGTNRILLGRHRKGGNSEWWTIEKEVKDDLHRELIIIHGQVQRGFEDEEAKMRVQRIAQILTIQKRIPEQDVCSYIIRNKLLPWGQSRIKQLLPEQYKRPYNNTKHKQKRNIIATNGEYEHDVESRVAKVKTALTNVVQVACPETIYPFNNCNCKTCPHKNECY